MPTRATSLRARTLRDLEAQRLADPVDRGHVEEEVEAELLAHELHGRDQCGGCKLDHERLVGERRLAGRGRQSRPELLQDGARQRGVEARLKAKIPEVKEVVSV